MKTLIEMKKVYCFNRFVLFVMVLSLATTFTSCSNDDDEDIPVYYDEERDQTLYAKFGTNISDPRQAESIDTSNIPRLLDAGISSSADLVLHKFNLGSYSDGAAAIVQINYDASSLDEAKQIAEL